MLVPADEWGRLFPPGSRRPVPDRWTDAQQAALDSGLHLTVFWGGNATGKSMWLAELARRAIRGQLPWQTPGQPYTVILCGNTWTQLGSTLRYFWDGIEPGEFKSGVRYEGGAIKGQRLAVYEVVGGPGQGGELRLGTFRAANLAGPRADLVLADEPLPADVYDELMPRLLGRNGRMFVTFTPTLGTAGDVDYLWALVDDPKRPWAGEIQVETSVENCTPRGGLVEVPFLRQVEIDRLADGVSAIQADMRLGKSRHPRRDCTYFDGVWDHRTLRVDWSPPAGTKVLVGIDHGSKANAQCAALIYVGGMALSARYHVADFYMSPRRTEMIDDARGILDMLIRNGLARRRVGGPPNYDLGDVDLWMGDRSHGGYRGGLGAKSNGDLQRALAGLVGFNVGALPAWKWREKMPAALRKIRVPKKRNRSMWDGMDVVRRMLAGGRLTVARRKECDPVQEAIERWQGALLDPMRDRLDAVRYAVVEVDSGRVSWAA